MITKRAVKQFLARPRKDFRNWQDLTPEEVDRYMRKLPVRPPIWSCLRLHQRVCLIIGAREQRFFIASDTGTGKTLLAIALARYFEMLGIVTRIMVLVPTRVNKSEWTLEINKYRKLGLLGDSTRTHVLWGSTESKWQQLETVDALLFVDTFMGFARMGCALVRNKKKKRNELKPDAKQVRRLMKLLQGIVADESTILGNHDNIPYRIVRKILSKAPIFFPMTATPFNRDPKMLWSQLYLVDKGYTLGETLGLFRAAFYSAKENYWGGTEYTFLKKNKPLLNQMLANALIRYEADAADLPKVNRISKYLTLPENADDYYQKARDRLIAARGDYQEQKNAFLRMRQISSGFVGYWDDETGSRAQFEFDENPKLELLLSLIENIREDRKIIIFHEYTYSGLRIVRELKALKIGAAHLYGGTRNTDTERSRYNTDPECRVLVLQNAFGLGLNLQVAQYGLYYESPVSAIIRKQTERRIERQESLYDVVFLYDLIMRGTMDEKILAFHAEGFDLMRSIVQGDVD